MSATESANDVRDMMLDTAGRLFADRVDRGFWQAVENGEFPQDLWHATGDMGLLRVLLDEQAGGGGLGVADGLALVELDGYHALALPLAETAVANSLLASMGQTPGDEVAVLAGTPQLHDLRLTRRDDGWRLDGHLSRIAWGRHANTVVLDVDHEGIAQRVVLAADTLPWAHDANLAGEPRDSVALDGLAIDTSAVAALDPSTPRVTHWGALIRALQMAGAMRRALELAVTYANERQQFGRPIARFQAIQQQLAQMAGEVAAAGIAAQTARRAVDGAEQADLAVAVAKARVGEAAGRCAAIAHQVLGAMGFTQEHKLAYFTRRLWAWRDEFGAEPYWQAVIGRRAAAQGSDGLWPFLSDLL